MATEALTADTNTRCLPWTYCLPLLPVPLCCTNCDGKNGAGQGAGAFVQCAMCWCMHSDTVQNTNMKCGICNVI